MQIGLSVAGLVQPLRLAQAKEITLRLKRSMPVQIDGEPLMLTSSEIRFSLRGPVPMLCNHKGASSPIPVLRAFDASPAVLPESY